MKDTEDYFNNHLFAQKIDQLYEYYYGTLTHGQIAKLIDFTTTEFDDYYEYVELMPDEKYEIFDEYFGEILDDYENDEIESPEETKKELKNKKSEKMESKHINEENTKLLHKYLKILDLRFPIAELARKTGHGKGNISNFIKGTKSTSYNFIKAVELEYKDELKINEPAGNIQVDNKKDKSKLEDINDFVNTLEGLFNLRVKKALTEKEYSNFKNLLINKFDF